MSALADYYAALAAKTGAESVLPGAQAQLLGQQALLTGAQARELPLTSASERALQAQQGGLFGAEAGRNRALAAEQEAQTGFLGRAGREALIRGIYASGRASLNNPAPRLVAPGTLTPSTQSQTTRSIFDDEAQSTRRQFGGLPNFNMGSEDIMPQNYDQGTHTVPGEGDGSHDTVPATLAPGEAVLNRGAAELTGRMLIKHLNDLGARMMAASGHTPDGMKGMPAPRAKAGKDKAGYAQGTDTVPSPQSELLQGMNSPLAQGARSIQNPSSGGQAIVDKLRGNTGYAQGTDNVPPAPQSELLQGMASPLAQGARSIQNPSSGGQSLVDKLRGNKNMGDENVQNYAMGTEYVAPLQGTTEYAIKANLSETGMSPGKGMPKAKGYAKGTAKVKKGRGGGKRMRPTTSAGPGLMPQAPMGDESQMPMDPRLMALMQAAGSQQ